MGRLYYDKVTPSRPSGKFGLDTAPIDPKNQNNVKSYLEKVSSLIPGEVIAGYLAMFGFIPLVDSKTSDVLSKLESNIAWIIFSLCLILTPVYLNYHADKDKPKKIHLIVSTIAFVIWAYVTTGKTLTPDLYNAAIGSIFLIAFSLISGVIKLSK